MSGADLPTDTTTAPETHALRLAAQGLAVLPVMADKRPAPGWGVTKATTDAQVIVDAFVTSGAPLVGVACGASRIVVVDVDRHEGGADGFASLGELPLSKTWTHTSNSGRGLHLVYAAPADAVAAGKPAPGIDLKAGAGYIVWPITAGVPDRSAFAPLPAGIGRPAFDPAGSHAAGARGEWRDWWLSVNGGEIDPLGSVAEALRDLPAHGSPEWTDPNLVPLALGVVRACLDGYGGALAREEFIARYAAGQWATATYRRAAERAFDAAIDAAGLFPIGVRYGSSDPDEASADGAEPAEYVAPPFRILSRADLRNRPRPEWMIEGLIQGAGVIVLAGEGGIGKSFLALDWAAHIATGTPWQGRATKRGRVLYVAAEGIDYFDDRLAAWEQFNTVPVPDDRLVYVEDGFNLSDERAVEYMREVVAGQEIDVVILDTMSQLSAVENENDNAQLSAVMRQAKAIREVRAGASVLILHHTNKGDKGRVRGASAIRNNADAVIVARAKAGTTFGISTHVSDDGKQKNGSAEYIGGLYLQPVGTSVVIDRERAADPEDVAIWEVLDRPGWHATAEVLAVLGASDEATRKRIVRRLTALVDLGRVVTEGATRSARFAKADALSDTLSDTD